MEAKGRENSLASLGSLRERTERGEIVGNCGERERERLLFIMFGLGKDQNALICFLG